MLLSEKSYNNPLGKCWDVIIDRPLGSTHPTFKETIYPINYGYIPGIIAGDGEEQDAYVVGISYPISAIHGKCIAIVFCGYYNKITQFYRRKLKWLQLQKTP